MKRFTERDEFGNADIIGVSSCDLGGDLSFEELNRLTRALNRLAELKDKLESGQLVELRFYIGQPLYLVGHLGASPIIEECKIKRMLYLS